MSVSSPKGQGDGQVQGQEQGQGQGESAGTAAGSSTPSRSAVRPPSKMSVSAGSSGGKRQTTAADRLKEDAKRRFKEASGQAVLEQSFDQMSGNPPIGTREEAGAKAGVQTGIKSGSTSGPKPESDQLAEPQSFERVEALLSFESEVRKAGSPSELNYLVVNESKTLISSELVLLHKVTPKGRLKKVELISSLAIPDDNSPLLIWLNKEIDAAVAKKSVSNTPFDRSPVYIKLKTQDAPQGTGSFPFTYALYVPHYSSNDQLLSGITYLRTTPFEASDGAFAERVGGTVAHALQALLPRRSSWPRLFKKPVLATCAVLIALAMFIPVTLTVLAPVEIVPDKPAVVASPLSGVIDGVDVQPNARVKKGQLLFRLNKVELLNTFEVSERNVAVAEAKYRRATQGSFGSSESKRELAVTKAEFEMAVAERDFASARLAQSDVVAARDGIVLYSGSEDWTGKPVVTGERIMRIADPANVKMRIEVETGDAIILGKGAGVNAFFDSNPLTPVAGLLETQSYQAETTDTNILVFPMVAAISKEQVIHQRIGLRGTAQIYGSEVPLWFFLFRKPISAIRQMVGL